MSTVTGSRWIDWKPKAHIWADSVENEPTKPTEPASEGFEGATSADSPEIEASPDPAELARASAVLNRAGVRIMALEGGATIGVWSDFDGSEVRAALRTFGSDRLPILYLDGAGVSARYKVRRAEGEPVPMNVLAEMEWRQADLMGRGDPMHTPIPCNGVPMKQEHPWTVRDRMLNEMGWRSKGIPWKAWGAASNFGSSTRAARTRVMSFSQAGAQPTFPTHTRA
jgi:hypothetical protein